MSCPVNLRALPSAVYEEVFTPENVRARPTSSHSLSTLSFPKSRCALWDGTPTGDKTLLHLCAHRAPRVQLTEKALRLAQRHIRHSSRPAPLCFLLGSVSVDSDEEGVTVTLDRFDPGRDQNGVRVPSAALPGDVCAPCAFTSDPSAPVQSEAELHQAFKVLLQSVSGRQSLDLCQILRLGLHVVWTQALDSARFSLTWSCVSPATGVHVEPVRAAHVIPTALLRSLTSPARPAATSRQKGFVTMDQGRKLLLLLESDPKALSLPLVGVWFSGVTHVHSPQVWAWTLRFLYSASIQDRALSESGCFLLLLFASTHRAPQFFQCKVNGPELSYQLLTGNHNTTLYQKVASVEGQTLKCELSPDSSSAQMEIFRKAHRAFSSSPAGALSVTDQDSGVEDEDVSPRPSPSPHLPSAQQTRRIEPSVPELSLLMDGSFLSNHNTAPKPQAPPPPPPSDRKPAAAVAAAASPLNLHSTPYSNLQPNCACCCKSNNQYQCTTIHATPGPNPKTPQNYQQNTPAIQHVHQTQSRKHSSPSNRHSSPSNRRPSYTNPPPTQQTPPLSQYSQTATPSQAASSPQHLATHSPNRQTPIPTANIHPVLQNNHSSPSNPAQNFANQNYTTEQTNANVIQNPLATPQPQPSPVFDLFHTPQNVGKLSPITASLNNSAGNTELLPQHQNSFQSPLSHSANLNLVQSCLHNGAAAVPSFASRSPGVMAPSSCGQPAFVAPPPPAAVCTNACCEQKVALSSGETYQLLLQQDRQLRLLQQQVQMLLEAQAKLQSSQQQTETQTKSTASIAVGTGASLFWPEPPTLRRDSSTSPPPSLFCLSVAPVGGAVSPPRSAHRASPPSRAGSRDQAELGAQRNNATAADEPSSPTPAHSGLSSVDSPVLGESASMYGPQEDQPDGFYHSLMTQLNSRLREEEPSKQEVKEPKQDEETRRKSLERTQSPAHSSLSSSSSSSAPGQVHSPVQSPAQVLAPAQGSKKNKKKKQSPRAADRGGEDVVVSATLRRLQQLGVNLDKQELSEGERARAKAVESAGTLACINPAAVVSRLSAPSASLALPPHPSSSSDLSLEANAIALRYLSDQQLTRLSLAAHNPKRAPALALALATPPSSSASTDITILSPSNMSLATRKYMKRYGLIEEESEDEDEEEEEKEAEREAKERPFCEALLPQSQLIRELKPKMQLLARNGQNRGGEEEEDDEKENARRKRQTAESQGSVGNILDLSRLRQLPKLF
ncbi:LOW QUALITY PROTEIN: SCL-interrupting locus protein homolog [Boleophthalmus pectinirostris]|uniref:LOW QUALITY PROTEIN: SCL-interrupting locus protein homolog n=1 Tax=Boleophthalmus pectinirostris TaxID=150288 RepID=UPI002430D97E|nr:LOW QUALITY PROTEIN: SCL-interrupting locus protein homolog [Boleophthalmus pectinirostris]